MGKHAVRQIEAWEVVGTALQFADELVYRAQRGTALCYIRRHLAA